MNTKQNESRIQNDLLDCEALVFVKNVFISSFCIAPLVVSGLRELSFSGYPEKDLKKKKPTDSRRCKTNRWLPEPVELPVESPVESATLDVSLLAGEECRKCCSQTAR